MKTKFKLFTFLLAFFLVFSYISNKAYAENLPNTTLLYLQRGQKEIVVLMHYAYGKETTVETLPQIIEYLKTQGYSFKALNQ